MPRPVLVPSAVLAAAVASLTLAGSAAAQAPGAVTSFSAGFTTKQPGAASGYVLRVEATPPAPGTTLPPFLRQVVSFPAGTRFDTRGAARCTASDADVARQGARPLCPAGSRIGTGVAEGILNGQRVHFDLVAYNFRGRVHFAAELDGQPLRQGFFGAYAGRTLTIDVPTAGGTVAPVLFSADIGASTRGRRRLITTPRRCPASRRWPVVTTFVGLSALGGGSEIGTAQRAATDVPCRARR